jgi:hypothetical protein
MGILLREVKPAVKKQTTKRAAFFLITRNKWGSRVKEVLRK